MVIRDSTGRSGRENPTCLLQHSDLPGPADGAGDAHLTRDRVPAGPPRPRLIDALSGGERLVVLHGPRLSGKTTLLRHWSRDSILARATAGILAPEPGITEDVYWARVVDSVGSRRVYDGPNPFAVLCSMLGSLQAPLTLLLDDLHVVDGPEVRIRGLLRVNPAPHLRIIATSRRAGDWGGPNALPPNRRVLTSNDLRFTRTELVDLLESLDLRADRQLLALLEAETGGMAGLVDAVVRDVRAVTHGGPGGEKRFRTVIDSLIDHSLTVDAATSAPSLTREFILCAAAAHPLTRPAVATIPGAPADTSLDGLDMLGLLVPGGDSTTVTDTTAEGRADPTEAAWHFPAVLRASLLRLAHNEDPDLLRDTRVSLARFWLERRRPHSAFVHAIDAADWDLVLKILRDHWQTLYSSHFLDMDHALSRIPEHLLRSDPLFDRLLRIHQRFSVPKDEAASAPPLDDLPGLPGIAEATMQMMGLRMNGHFDAAVAECPPLAARPIPDLATASQTVRDGYAFTTVHVGITYLMVGRFDDAIAVLRRGHRAGAGTFLERDAAGKLALAHALLGRLDDAEEWVDAERRHGPLAHDAERVVRPAGMVAAALTSLDRLDTTTALELISDLGAPDDREEFWGFMLYVYGQLALATGTPADGLRYVEQQLRRFPTMHDHGAVVDPLLTSVRADLLLALDRPEAARELIGESTDPHTAAARGRVLLHCADPTGTLEIVHRYETDLRCTARDSLELSLLGAASSVALDAGDDALKYLARATTQAQLTELLYPFITIPATSLRTLVELWPALPVDPSTIPSAFPNLPAPAASATRTPRIDALTVRERAVLQSLASGATNREIAEEHYVSLNTVKSQLRSLYSKLGTSTRDETIEVARRLNLV